MLEARQLTVTLGGLPALHALDAIFRPGEVTAICGPNGAGKSTLLGALAGLVPADAGMVLLDGVPLKTWKPADRARAIGYLPQAGAAAWDVDVRTLVALGRLPHGDARVDSGLAAIRRALLALDLEHLSNRPLSRLSGGERARALLARVLAGEPRWVLADEPLAALDLAHQLALLARLRTVAEEGAGVVLVLHDLALAMNHAHRVIVLQDGRIAADGTPDAALCEPVIAQVWGVSARWLGEPGARALVTG